MVELLDLEIMTTSNLWLSLKCKAHINLESCSSAKSVKYLNKFIYKGHDYDYMIAQILKSMRDLIMMKLQLF